VFAPPNLATSLLVDGILTWAIPLAVFLGVLVWYLLILRRHHPR
jgi:hypothetical protein